jgi:adenylate kinase family enzyme
VSRASIEDLQAACRVLVYGVTGSGKSVTAGRLGELTDLPVHLVDEEIGWLPDWVERDTAEQRAIAAGVVDADRWILDSAYGKWLDVVVPRVEVVVGLDYPRWVSLSRLLRRTARRWARHEVVCNGNVESLPKILSPDSILVWHFRSFARKRARIRDWEAQPDGIPVLRVQHPRELAAVLQVLAADRVTGSRARSGPDVPSDG